MSGALPPIILTCALIMGTLLPNWGTLPLNWGKVAPIILIGLKRCQGARSGRLSQAASVSFAMAIGWAKVNRPAVRWQVMF